MIEGVNVAAGDIYFCYSYTHVARRWSLQSWNVQSATRTTLTTIYGGSLIIIGDRLFNNRAVQRFWRIGRNHDILILPVHTIVPGRNGILLDFTLGRLGTPTYSAWSEGRRSGLYIAPPWHAVKYFKKLRSQEKSCITFRAGAYPAIGGPDGRPPVGLGSALWENCVIPLAYNIEFIIIIIIVKGFL